MYLCNGGTIKSTYDGEETLETVIVGRIMWTQSTSSVSDRRTGGQNYTITIKDRATHSVARGKNGKEMSGWEEGRFRILSKEELYPFCRAEWIE